MCLFQFLVNCVLNWYHVSKVRNIPFRLCFIVCMFICFFLFLNLFFFCLSFVSCFFNCLLCIFFLLSHIRLLFLYLSPLHFSSISHSSLVSLSISSAFFFSHSSLVSLPISSSHPKHLGSRNPCPRNWPARGSSCTCTWGRGTWRSHTSSATPLSPGLCEEVRGGVFSLHFLSVVRF